MSICLLDSSVLCNLLEIPGKTQHRRDVMSDFQAHAKRGAQMLLPLATVLETGNHVSRISDGWLRRKRAETLVGAVRDTLCGRAPWSPIASESWVDIDGWIDGFPDMATREISMGDLSIIREYERQCKMYKGRHVFIWTFDNHLMRYDRPPPR